MPADLFRGARRHKEVHSKGQVRDKERGKGREEERAIKAEEGCQLWGLLVWTRTRSVPW